MRTYDGKTGLLIAPAHYSEAEADAFRSGAAAAQAFTEPGDDRLQFNPYDPDDVPTLYEAWDAGFDLDDG